LRRFTCSESTRGKFGRPAGSQRVNGLGHRDRLLTGTAVLLGHGEDPLAVAGRWKTIDKITGRVIGYGAIGREAAESAVPTSYGPVLFGLRGGRAVGG
jgi:hypothetical protein